MIKKIYNNKELTYFIIELLTSKTKLEELYTYYKQFKKNNSVTEYKVYESILELLFRKGNTFYINTNERTKEGFYEIDNYKILDENYNYDEYNDTQIIDKFLHIINNDNKLTDYCKNKQFDESFKYFDDRIEVPENETKKIYYNYVYNYLYKQTKNPDNRKFKKLDLANSSINIPVNIILKKKEKHVIKDKKKDKTCKAIYERLKGTMKNSSNHFNNVRKIYIAKLLLGGKKTKKIRKNKKRTIKNY